MYRQGVVDILCYPITLKLRQAYKLPPRQINTPIDIGYLHYCKS